MPVYSLDNPVFKAFAFYATASIIKMFLLVFLTVKTRFQKGVFANMEDVKAQDLHKKDVKPNFTDDDVERIRRNHLNDLENIIPFVLLGLLYIGCNPNLETALWHFRVFFASRVGHMISYQLAIRQPARALTFVIGLIVNMSMAVRILGATF